MTSVSSSQVEKHISALRISLSKSISNDVWVDFEGYTDFLVELIGIASDNSLSPSRSSILRSLFNLVGDISKILLERGEYNQALVFGEKTYNRYFDRKRNKEKPDVISYLSGDFALWNPIKAVFDEIESVRYQTGLTLFKHAKRLEFMKSIYFSFLSNRDNSVFEFLISVYFRSLLDNVSVGDKEWKQVVCSNINELFRLTERDLGKYHKSEYGLSQDIVLKSYIYDWTSIINGLYYKNEKELVKLIFSFSNSPTIGTELIAKKLFPCLALNLIVIVLSDREHEDSHKTDFLSFAVNDRYQNYDSLSEYALSILQLPKLDLLKDSYKNMTNLVEVWKSRSSTMTSFDYSPEIFLILVCAFLYDISMYPVIVRWTCEDQLPRCDRFNEIIQGIKDCVNEYPEKSADGIVSKLFTSFTSMFVVHELQSRKNEIIEKLDTLWRETYSLLKSM
ncbi:MAG: hypothetical protein PHY48_05305 [Candidatus Cloacimonetes bacterium]|nr:hypothetical protein [Candidatus Cloacimonadota bacterium]